MSGTAWPDGVLARYLTVGGATVDVLNANEWRPGYALCLGCKRSSDDGDAGPDSSRPTIWAQSHAATCRAMPRPTI